MVPGKPHQPDWLLHLCGIQGRRHLIWGGQVGSAHARTLWSGGMLPREVLKFRGYEIASETIFGPI